MHTPLIELRALDRRFGPRAALSDIDLVVGPGEIHGLIGPRGSGKTTLLRVLAGELQASAGFVFVPARTDARALRTRSRSRGRSPTPPTSCSSTSRAWRSPPATRRRTRALVARHAARGGAVVWATRRLDDLQGLASGVTLLAGGRVRYSGTVEALALRALAGSELALAAAA